MSYRTTSRGVFPPGFHRKSLVHAPQYSFKEEHGLYLAKFFCVPGNVVLLHYIAVMQTVVTVTAASFESFCPAFRPCLANGRLKVKADAERFSPFEEHSFQTRILMEPISLLIHIFKKQEKNGF